MTITFIEFECPKCGHTMAQSANAEVGHWCPKNRNQHTPLKPKVSTA